MRSRINEFKTNLDDIKSLVKKKNYTDIKLKTLNKHIELTNGEVVNITVDVNTGNSNGNEEVIEKRSVDNMVQSIAKAVIDNTKENMAFPKNIVISANESLIDEIDLANSSNYEDVDLSIIRLFSPRKDLKDLLITSEVKKSIDRILAIYNNSKKASKILDMNPFIKGSKSIVCNFYGKEGMGKATVAEAIAKSIEKKILTFSYNELKATPIDEIPIKIKAIFNFAKKKNAVVVITEADSLIRNVNTAGEKHVYRDITRSIIKEEIVKLNSMVFFICHQNDDILDYYKSLILVDLEFELPDEDEREMLWEHFISNNIELSPIVTPEILAQKFTDVTILEIKSILFLATCIAIEENREILYEIDFDIAYDQVKSIY